MNRLQLFAALCATMCLTGCLSTEVSKSEVCGTEHIFVHDYGWKLFNWIPIFRSDITLERVQDALMAESRRRGKVPSDLVYHNLDNVMLNIPFFYITIPIPYLICYHDIQLSGVLK